MDHLNKEILWLTYNNKHLAVALCSIHVELYNWLQVCLCFRRGIYRKSLWNKHDTTTIAQNFTDFFHQYNRCQVYQSRVLSVCPFSGLTIQSTDFDVPYLCSFPWKSPESAVLCSAANERSRGASWSYEPPCQRSHCPVGGTASSNL